MLSAKKHSNGEESQLSSQFLPTWLTPKSVFQSLLQPWTFFHNKDNKVEMKIKIIAIYLKEVYVFLNLQVYAEGPKNSPVGVKVM